RLRGEGHDTILGAGGARSLHSFPTRRSSDLGNGNDTVLVGVGDNIGTGGDGDDSIVTSVVGSGNDLLSGDLGNDTLAGNDGNDRPDDDTGEVQPLSRHVGGPMLGGNSNDTLA